MANPINMPSADEVVAMAEKFNAWDIDAAKADAEHEGSYQCVGCEGRGYIVEFDHDPTPLCHECAHNWVQMFAQAIPDMAAKHALDLAALAASHAVERALRRRISELERALAAHSEDSLALGRSARKARGRK